MNQTLKFIIAIILPVLAVYGTHLVISEIISNYPTLINKDVKSMYFISYMLEIFILVSIIIKFDKNK